MNVIMAPCFLRHRDPQRPRKRWVETDELLSAWKQGVDANRLHGRIFYDGLSSAFMEKHSSERVRFEYFAHEDSSVSCNDWRFWAYREWLKKHPEVEKVFCTDLFDVRVVQDPFSLIDGQYKLYVAKQPSPCGVNYFRAGWRSSFDEDLPSWLEDQPRLNAGIFGGYREDVVEFCSLMVEQILTCWQKWKDRGLRGKPNANMPVFNFILYGQVRNFWAEGAPLHSIFRKYENDRRDVYFIHK